MIAALAQARAVFFDTAPLIYFVEENRAFLQLLEPLMESIDRGEKRGISSFVTFAEVLVKPLELGRVDLARAYRTQLLDHPHFSLIAVERAVAERAAEIRAHHSFELADAIGLAAAVEEGADVFVTNDAELRSFQGLPIVVLRDHTGRTS